MIWIAIIAIILFFIGVFIRDGNIYPETVWVPIGKFLMYVSLFVFICFAILSVIVTIIKR